MRLQSHVARINLFILLCKGYQPDVNDFLARQGYRVYWVDRRVSLPMALYASVVSSPRPQRSCNPDLILLSERKGCALLIECKASSFGPQTEPGVPQALTYLLLSPEILADQIGASFVRQTLSIFVVPAQQVNLQQATLQDLAKHVLECGQAPACVQTWGVGCQSQGVVLTNLTPCPCQDERGTLVVVQTPDPEQWEPLRFIPIDPQVDSEDQEGLRIVGEKFRNVFVRSVLSQLGDGPGVVTLSVRGICSEIVELWDSWNPDSQRWFRRLVRRLLKTRLEALEIRSLAQVESDGKGDVYRLEVPGEDAARAIREYLLSRESRKAESEPTQQELLPFEDSEDPETAYDPSLTY